MRVSHSAFESKAHIYANMLPETIQHVADQLEKGVNHFEDPNERHVFDLMRDVHLINSSVMGSGAARLKMRHQIQAMIASHGAPSFFITINPADVYSPILKLLSGDDIDINDLLPDQIPTYHNQSILIAKDPALAARFFHIYMKSFFHTVLQYDLDNPGGVKPNMLGITRGYYGTVEAQGRGSLHCHLLLWLEGGLNPSEIRDRIFVQPFGTFEKRLITYLESNICTGMPPDPGDVPNVPSSNVNPCSVRPISRLDHEPDDRFQLRRQKDLVNLVNQCQRHTHNAGCYKNWKGPPDEKTCRFNLDQSNQLDCTTIDRTSGEIRLKTADGLINPFNQAILEMVRCNMDITFIGSGYSALAVLYYITDYISKQQLKTHVAYNLLEHALVRLNQYNDCEDTDHVRAKRVLMRCANAVISKQELSAQQIASYLLGSSDFYASHTFKDFYWKTYEGYILHCLPDPNDDEEAVHPPSVLRESLNDGHESDSSSEPTSVQSDTPQALPWDDAVDDKSGRVDSSIFADPTLECNEFITVSIDAHGQLKPKATTVSDYIYRPKAMQPLCLWDFLSMTSKILSAHMSTLAADDIDDDDDSVMSDDGSTSGEHVPPHSSFIDILECMYKGTLKTSTFPFDEKHPDHSTHVVQILPPSHHHTLVPLGPPIPR